MREWIGHLVACKGAEQAAARMAVGISHQFPCKADRADRVQAPIDALSIGARVATFDPATFYLASCSAIMNIYDSEIVTEPAIEAIAGAFPDFGLFD
jgi:hypothetical protein